jgi:protein-tyrosine-phosphatase
MPEPTPEVLFVCVHNAGRSQIAALADEEGVA